MQTLRTRALVVALAAVTLSACGKDPSGPGAAPGTGKALVLVTYGDPGVSIVGDTGSAVGHVGFGDAFDGSAFTVVGDTAFSTSSKFGGDELFVANLATGAVRLVQLPAGSNPGGVAVLPSSFVGAQGSGVAVALRDSGAVFLLRRVRDTNLDFTVLSLLRDAGACPTDVFAASETIWSIDSNQDCRDQYQVLGPARVIGMLADSARRDTVVLTGSYGAGRALLSGSSAFVVTTGDYGAHPGTIAQLRVTSRMDASLASTLPLPAGYYATAARLGKDGRIYVTASLGYPSDYAPRVFEVDPSTLRFAGQRAGGQQFRDLRDAAGDLVRCDAATADARGDVYCASNGGISSRLLVFDAIGTLLRNVPTGGLAADIEVR